jgi:ATP synthase protein I
VNYIDPVPKDSVKSRGFSSEDSQASKVLKNDGWEGDLSDSEEFARPLTKTEMEALLGHALLQPSRITVKRLLILQGLVTIISAATWSATGKSFSLDSATMSAIFGGLAALVPSALFAARAKFLGGRSSAIGSTVFALVTGELLKIIATIAIFILVIVFYPELDWLPLLLTYVFTLKCYLLAWLLK